MVSRLKVGVNKGRSVPALQPCFYFPAPRTDLCQRRPKHTPMLAGAACSASAQRGRELSPAQALPPRPTHQAVPALPPLPALCPPVWAVAAALTLARLSPHGGQWLWLVLLPSWLYSRPDSGSSPHHQGRRGGRSWHTLQPVYNSQL